MVKKLFGLASLTALTGILVIAAGCSSKIFVYAPDEGGLEGGKVPKPGDPGFIDGGVVRKDASFPPPNEDGGIEPGGTCPSTAPITAGDIEAQLLWKPPASFTNVCTQQNINDVKALFKGAGSGGVKYSDIKTALGAACGSCAFSPSVSGTNWQVFVEEPGGAVDNSAGSCFAQLSGNPCGKARFEWETCLDIACPATDCGASGVASCTPKATKGACKDLTAAYVNACPNEADNIAKCKNFFAAIAMSCSGGPTNTIDTTPP